MRSGSLGAVLVGVGVVGGVGNEIKGTWTFFFGSDETETEVVETEAEESNAQREVLAKAPLNIYIG